MTKNYNDFDIDYENNKNGWYNINKTAYYNNNSQNNHDKNMINERVSPLRRSYDYLIKSNKYNIYQSENLTINKVSPSHVLYRPLNYDDGGYINNKGNILPNKKVINQRYINTENNDNNSDNKYSNIYGFKRTDEKRYKNYLRNPYYKGEDIEDGYKHYNPEENNFSGSSYGGYIYNYYLNAPMRSDKTENWRFPPLYYYRPKFKYNNL